MKGHSTPVVGIIGLVCIVAQLITLSHAVIDESPANLTANPGATDVKIVWKFPQGVNTFTVTLENPATGITKVLGSALKSGQTNLADGVNGYVFHLGEPTSDGLQAILEIATVGHEHNGKYTITGTADNDGKVTTKTVKLIVTRPVETVKLSFNDLPFISVSPEDPLEVMPGSYPVKCVAEGSNPAVTKLEMNRDGTILPIDTNLKEESLMEGVEVEKYSTSEVATVDFKNVGRIHKLECVATSADSTNRQVDLEVMVVGPSLDAGDAIACEETDAREGEEMVTLTCSVDTTQHTDQIVNFAFEIGKTGEIISAPEVDPKAGDGSDKDKVTVTKISDTETKVTLTLNKVEAWHFESSYYLVLEFMKGRVEKETVRLRESRSASLANDDATDNDDHDSGNSLRFSSLQVVVVCLVSLVTVSMSWIYSL